MRRNKERRPPTKPEQKRKSKKLNRDSKRGSRNPNKLNQSLMTLSRAKRRKLEHCRIYSENTLKRHLR